MDELNPWAIAAQLINFILFFLIFKHFLWKKIVMAIEERKKKLEQLDLIEQECNSKIEKAKEEADMIIKETRKRSEEIENFAINSANKQKNDIITRAEQEAKWLLDSASKEIEIEKNKMLSTIKTRVVDLALKVNQKLFDKSNINKDFVERELNSIN